MGWGSGSASFPYLITPLEAIQARAREDHSSVSWFLSNWDLDGAANTALGQDVARTPLKRLATMEEVADSIVFLASPMSSFIFYPAINSIAHSLDVTVGLVNLAITTYMVVSGVTPALLGNAADKIGRRPVYLLALGLYFVANIGLALQSDFAALLVLRMLQSAGSSGTCSLSRLYGPLLGR